MAVVIVVFPVPDINVPVPANEYIHALIVADCGRAYLKDRVRLIAVGRIFLHSHTCVKGFLFDLHFHLFPIFLGTGFDIILHLWHIRELRHYCRIQFHPAFLCVIYDCLIIVQVFHHDNIHDRVCLCHLIHSLGSPAFHDRKILMEF